MKVVYSGMVALEVSLKGCGVKLCPYWVGGQGGVWEKTFDPIG